MKAPCNKYFRRADCDYLNELRHEIRCLRSVICFYKGVLITNGIKPPKVTITAEQNKKRRLRHGRWIRPVHYKVVPV